MAKAEPRRGDKLHLPDCAHIQDFSGDTKCDCGTPPHPLPTNKALVRRKGRMTVIAKSKVKRGERDYS